MSINFRNIFGTVVHSVPEGLTPIEFRNVFGTVVHSEPTLSGSLSDIGYSTSSANFQWSWQAVPTGSSLTNQSYPLPDNNANTYFDMTDNAGLWHFEGNADDTSGNGNNGTVNGATIVAGRVGSEAYLFNGSSNYITAPSDLSLQITGDISIAAWIKANGYAQWGSIIQYSNPGEAEANNYLYNIAWANGSGDLRLFWEYGGGNNVTTDFSTNLDTGRWYHIVAVRDTSENKAYLYVDGELFDSQVYSNNPTGGGTAQLWIGKDPNAGVHFDGTIDEVALWSRPLSLLEINNLYFLQSGSLASDLVGNVGLGETFAFVPDVTGTFTTNLAVTDGGSSIDGNVNALISTASVPPGPSPTPVITGSNPTVKLIESKELGYVFNTYKIQNLSVQRSRTTEQVPFKIGTKGKQSLRISTNTEFTGSS